MQKIVINTEVGLFWLSQKATYLLRDRGSKYFYEFSFNEFYEKKQIEKISKNIDEYIKKDMISYGRIREGVKLLEADYRYNIQYEKDLGLKLGPQSGFKCRSDPLLVQIVEELGDEASVPDRLGALKILEIPDNIDWFIESYDDGTEWIAEKHRTWGYNGK